MGATVQLTPPQEGVLGILAKAGKPLSAYTILNQLDDVKSPPIVYRALDKLVSLGLIHRLASLNAYIACCQHGQSKCGHAHHRHDHDHVSQFAICTACGGVEELDSAELSQLAKTASQGFLGTIQKNVFEVTGLCHACAKAA